MGKHENQKDIIENTSGSITWSLDNKSFFYSKLDKFHRPRQIYKHEIGTPVNSDKLIFEEPLIKGKRKGKFPHYYEKLDTKKISNSWKIKRGVFSLH